MKIAHVTPFYYPVIGGVENVVEKVAEFMVSRGHDVYVITYNRLRKGGERSLPWHEIINNVQVIRVKPDFTWSHGTYSSEISKVLTELRPDIVHVHVWRHPHVFQIAKLRKKSNFKAILQPHGPFHTLQQLGTITWFYHKIVDSVPYFRYIMRDYEKIVALTHIEQEILQRKFHIQSDKITIIPNFVTDDFIVEAKRYLNRNREPVVLYLGRLCKEKNVNLLIQVARQLSSEAPDVKIVIAGPAESRKYEMLLNTMKNVVYVGPVYDIAEKVRLYTKAKVFISTSIYESFLTALLEAQACGSPCVITGFGGQLCAAPPNISSLWAPPDAVKFTRTILSLMKDEGLYFKLKEGGLKWAKLHQESKILPMYELMYNSIVNA